MKRLGVLAFVVVLAGCGSGASDPELSAQPGAPFGDFATSQLDGAKAKALQDVLDKVVQQHSLSPEAETSAPGATAAVVSDQWSWSGAAGKDAVGTALTPATAMGVASITKTFVAAEVLLLAEQKKVDLDAPLNRYVRHKLTANGATVRQHLGMRSGLANYAPDDYGRMDRQIRAAPGAHWTPQQALSYATAPVGQPGSFSYSNPSYVLLGLLIEQVTGEPLANVIRRDLAAGLTHVAFQDGEKVKPPAVEDRNPVCGKVADGFLPCRAIASLSAANAGLAADALSVAQWGYRLYGGRVLSAGSTKLLTEGEGQYGLGTMLFSQAFGPVAYGHRGEMPDYTSLLVVMPDKRVSISLLLAAGNKQVDTVMAEFAAAVVPLLD